MGGPPAGEPKSVIDARRGRVIKRKMRRNLRKEQRRNHARRRITLKADLILIDERKSSTGAASKGFEITGTLGILDLAAKRKLIDLRGAIER